MINSKERQQWNDKLKRKDNNGMINSKEKTTME